MSSDAATPRSAGDLWPAASPLAAWAVCRDYGAALWECRYFWYALAKSDIASRYKGTALGVGWSLLHPLAMTAVVCVVFSRMFSQDPASYAPFLLAGLTFWNYVSAMITGGCECIRQGGPFLRQYPLPLAAFPMRTTIAAGFHLVISLVAVITAQIVLAGLPWDSFPQAMSALAAAATGIAMLFIAGTAAACVFGIFNLLFPDVNHLSQVGLQVLFYATPVLYPPELLQTRGMGWLVRYNPIAGALDWVRAPLLDGGWPAMGSMAVTVGGTAALLVIAAMLLSHYERRIVFYL